jgi:hypothetical protein
VARGFAHARGIGSHALHPQRIILYVYLFSVGRPQARWSDDLRRMTGRSWMLVAEDRARRREIGEAYVQQWTAVG